MQNDNSKLKIILVSSIIFFAVLLLPKISWAATINAASCSQTDVQATINAANDGDTILIPSGNCIWTTIIAGTPAISVPNTKGLIIKGAGVDQTVIQDNTGTNYGEWLLVINSAEGKSFRLTGIKFIRSTDAGSSNTAMIIVSGSSKDWRIDHCTMEYIKGSIFAIVTDGYTYGVVDNCSFVNTKPVVFADEDASWNRPLALGTKNAVYFEDNVFYQYNDCGSDAIDGRSGARIVFRYNEVHNNMLHLHGTDGGGARGTHSYEYYGNKMYDDAGFNCYRYASIRGGTGVIWNNTAFGDWGTMTAEHNCACTTDPNDSRCGGAKFCTGYPCLDQIGRTTDSNNDGVQDLVPLFVWDNKDDEVIKNMTISGCDVVHTTYLKEGRDFYNNSVIYNSSTGVYEAQYTDDDGSVKQWKYKPYTYPHPLRAEAAPPPDTTPPSPPTGVTII